MKTKLSRTTLGVFALIAFAGLGYGYYRYLHQPATFPPNDPKNNAILIHIIIAVCAVVTVVAIQKYRNRRHLSNIWAAPFSQNALQRLKATMFPKHVTPLSIIRSLACLLPLLMVVFEPFRSGTLFPAEFAPSESANAWGGPTYIGATLAHLMDCVILVYVGAFVLHLIMVKRVANSKTVL